MISMTSLFEVPKGIRFYGVYTFLPRILMNSVQNIEHVAQFLSNLLPYHIIKGVATEGLSFGEEPLPHLDF